MIETEAIARLSDLVAASVFPTLDAGQLSRLIRDARRVDDAGWLPSWDTEWAPATAYAVDEVIVPTVRNGHVYIITVGGTSGAVEPVWPTTPEGVVTLDGVTYQEVSSYLTVWGGAYDLNRAAAAGWRIKAASVSNRHDFGSNQGNYNPSQVFDHCMKMAEHYAAKGVSSIVLSSGRWDGSGRLNAAHFDDAV